MSNKRYRRYMLGLLTLILAFNYVDRAVLSIVLQDLKEELSITDSQIGLLTGLAFALFYAAMGVPLARWADQGNRRNIIALTTTAWSVMVVLCGMAGSFLHLLVARIGVAVGEAGCVPPANSLIPEYFTREERPRAMSIYTLGSPLSLILGFSAGGWLNEIVGWRMTFILLGIPGMVLGCVSWLTLKEPRRLKGGKKGASSGQMDPNISIGDVAKYLWCTRTFRHLVMGYAVAGFFGIGIGVWLPSFFMRSHGMQTAEVGLWMALTHGVIGAAGLYAGGELASRFAAAQERRQFRWISVLMAMSVLISAATYLSPNKYLALTLMGMFAFGLSSIAAPMFAAIQSLTPAAMRAQAIAVIFFFNSLIGLGVGPLAAGLLSDALAASFGVESLRYTLALFSPGFLWGAAHFWMASRTIEVDVNRSRIVPEVERGTSAASKPQLSTEPSALAQ